MKRSDRLQNLLTAVLTLCAVLVTALVVRKELFPRPAASEPRAPAAVVPEWESYVVPRNRAGPAEAPVTIVEFSDFQCPFCRTAAARLDSLRQRFPREVAVVYRHFPLEIHAHAVAAVRASECAGEQDRFWPMHDALYGRQDSIGRVDWERFASLAGVRDPGSFRDCMARGGEMAVLDEDSAAAARLGVRATPTLLINQFQVVGAPPLDTLAEYVRRAMTERNGAD